ncbi:SDR family NAD(P)-dependent oxidoreductase [Halopseudomonas aestusnigri]|jgi:short-subunit dehydrogenase|uniref:SDR family NAD(P)-dependent oxidoreductase n=1 Tax=Halopseudomonas TaxID=2901189 RepID=UPI000C374A8F|nr:MULTISPECIES: SDR family NAD(P)-dependent oxidoreductase [Halopseudomonas]MAK72952.1 short-chain dehydrogenase [Pseudomonadales bacterium]HBT56235.1 short-chain dehydrogenase [Pseudomonas sp.]MAY08450.1 short-chain dehydrogenase [Pseudomonadales bacterium]MCC4259933.1 SDR family NAD(P)-dependent oxidoreductase [Halopseudomonas aestusnigri]MCK5531946.1 SDR family NAD(P)-dependent oxidoreductase [Halopseudomonas aestusnigri]|tara:strand:- start:1878 stop:2732 length:855 start_codon:yes stop_codon:yes gene_type:complete
MSFASRVVWITGASSGIGEALARAMLAQGAEVILSGRRADALQALAAVAPERTLVLPFETTDYDRLPALVEQAWGWRGRIDLLINNAGISQRSLALDTSLQVYRQLMEVDYLAPVALTQLLLPRLVEQGSGQLAVVSSVAGKLGAPLRTGYCGAKHAVVGYFEALRAEVEQAYGIGVSVIIPGSVRTAIAANALEGGGNARGRSDANIDNGIDPDDAARTIIEGLSAGKHDIVVAEGMELMALQMRASDPERTFAFTAAEGAKLAQQRAELGAGASIDPNAVNR